ncbi:hypothetical protein FRX31_025472, partial [Thalictrum thalictroides]
AATHTFHIINFQVATSFRKSTAGVVLIKVVQNLKELAVKVKIAKPVTAGAMDTHSEARLSGITVLIGRLEISAFVYVKIP